MLDSFRLDGNKREKLLAHRISRDNPIRKSQAQCLERPKLLAKTLELPPTHRRTQKFPAPKPAALQLRQRKNRPPEKRQKKLPPDRFPLQPSQRCRLMKTFGFARISSPNAGTGWPYPATRIPTGWKQNASCCRKLARDSGMIQRDGSWFRKLTWSPAAESIPLPARTPAPFASGG